MLKIARIGHAHSPASHSAHDREKNERRERRKHGQHVLPGPHQVHTHQNQDNERAAERHQQRGCDDRRVLHERPSVKVDGQVEDPDDQTEETQDEQEAEEDVRDVVELSLLELVEDLLIGPCVPPRLQDGLLRVLLLLLVLRWLVFEQRNHCLGMVRSFCDPFSLSLV